MTPPATPGRTGVVVCADDFADSQSVSLAIVRLAQAQRISAASAMVLSPRWAHDGAALRELRGTLDVGLHLDWTSAHARRAGHGLRLGAAMFKALRGGFAGAALADTRCVIERQLDLFESLWQAPPSHVDGHQHVQQFAGIRTALVATLVKRYGRTGQVKPYLRISRPAHADHSVKGWLIAAMGADRLQALASAAALPSSLTLAGIYDFAGSQARYARLMAHWLKNIPPQTILMCHPAQAAEPDDPIGTTRLQEFNYLLSEDFAAALAHSGVQIVRGNATATLLKSAGEIIPD